MRVLSGRFWGGGRGRGARQAGWPLGCQRGEAAERRKGGWSSAPCSCHFPFYKWLVLNGPEQLRGERTLDGEDRSRRWGSRRFPPRGLGQSSGSRKPLVPLQNPEFPEFVSQISTLTNCVCEFDPRHYECNVSPGTGVPLSDLCGWT